MNILVVLFFLGMIAYLAYARGYYGPPPDPPLAKSRRLTDCNDAYGESWKLFVGNNVQTCDMSVSDEWGKPEIYQIPAGEVVSFKPSDANTTGRCARCRCRANESNYCVTDLCDQTKFKEGEYIDGDPNLFWPYCCKRAKDKAEFPKTLAPLTRVDGI